MYVSLRAIATFYLVQLGIAVALFLLCCLSGVPSWGQAASPPRPPNTLSDILDDIRWDSEQQGALLIVDPKHTDRAMRKKFFGYGGYSLEPIAEFPPPVPGGYRFNNIADYFGRRLVRTGTVSVFAPATMVVLNYRDLPKPSPYAGMSRTERLRLLAGSLKPAQWRHLTGADGLGLGDLDGRQRELFTAAFAENIRITRWVSGGSGEAQSSDVITLTPGQKAGIRLRVRRHLSWMYELGENGLAGLGDQAPTTSSGTVQMSLEFGEASMSPPAMFGATVREEVPARLKQGQMPFDWSALDQMIPLAGTPTIGDLIRRVADQTRVEVYCDIRYRSLPVYVRGEAARAGDLLKALCWAVNGTFRRVGPAFVLTDDLVGLGTRHSIIAEWEQANATLARKAQEEVTKSLKAVHADEYVAWDPNDPLGADDKLQTRIAGYRERLKKPMTEGERQNPNLRQLSVPVSELPPAVQEIVKGQVDRYRRGEIRFGENQEMRTDRVILQTDARLVYLIPDVGEVPSGEDSGLSEFVNDQNLIYNYAPPRASDPKLPRSVTLKADGKPHALVLGPASADEVSQAVAAAKRAGFTELWINSEPEEASAIEAVIAEAKKAGLSVRTLVRVLRQKPKASDVPADVTIRGETFTEFAARRQEAPVETGIGFYPGGGLLQGQANELLRQKRIGDWLRCDLPDSHTALAARVARIAALPGLRGVVLTDLYPPGYANAREPMGLNPWAWSLGPDAQFGYSEEMRLAFLRQTGVDPVDLSATGSRFANIYVPYRNNWFNGEELPFFNDYGPAAGNMIMNGVRGTEMGARDSWPRWNQFRQETAQRFRSNLLREIKTRVKDAPFFAASPASNTTDSVLFWYGSVDKELVSSKANANPPDAQPPPTPTADRSPDLAVKAKALSETTYAVWTYFPTPPFNGVPDQRTDFQQQAGAWLPGLQRGVWDGVVIDLSSVPTATAISLLGSFDPPTSKGMETELPAVTPNGS